MAHERLYRIRVPGGLQSGVSARIAADSQVDFVEPNRIRHAVVAAPNDPFFGSSWWFQAVQAVQAWSLLPGQYLTAATAGTGRVKVAILDTGADCTHPDFINAGGNSTDSAQGGQLMFSASQAFVATTILNPVCPWQDDHGHGTHVTGIVAAATSNGVGVSGLGYPVQVIEYKVLDSTGSGNDFNISNAIYAAVDAGAQVISMSLGQTDSSAGPAYSQAPGRRQLCVAAQHAGGRGCRESHFDRICLSRRREPRRRCLGFGFRKQSGLFLQLWKLSSTGGARCGNHFHCAYVCDFPGLAKLRFALRNIHGDAICFGSGGPGGYDHAERHGGGDSPAYGADCELPPRPAEGGVRISDSGSSMHRTPSPAPCGPRPTERSPAKSSMRPRVRSAEPRSPLTTRPSPRTTTGLLYPVPHFTSGNLPGHGLGPRLRYAVTECNGRSGSGHALDGQDGRDLRQIHGNGNGSGLGSARRDRASSIRRPDHCRGHRRSNRAVHALGAGQRHLRRTSFPDRTSYDDPYRSHSLGRRNHDGQSDLAAHGHHRGKCSGWELESSSECASPGYGRQFQRGRDHRRRRQLFADWRSDGKSILGHGYCNGIRQLDTKRDCGFGRRRDHRELYHGVLRRGGA